MIGILIVVFFLRLFSYHVEGRLKGGAREDVRRPWKDMV